MSFFCMNQCCCLQTRKYHRKHTLNQDRDKFNRIKGGVFIFDKDARKVLFVQTRGKKWGPPKGTIEDTDENVLYCARREACEETGIDIDIKDLVSKIKIDRTTYFLYPMTEDDVNLSDISEFKNDSSGIGWINVDCLKILYEGGLISLNYHGKKLLKRVFKIDF